MDQKIVNKVFSEFIRDKMDRTGLNQSELARKTGVSQERISRIVNDESRISLQDFVMLCSVLDVDFTRDLINKVGSKSKYYVNHQSKNRLPERSVSMPKSSDGPGSAYPLQYPKPNVPLSHELLQALSFISDFKEHHSTPTCGSARMFPVLRIPDGVWRSPSFIENSNRVFESFQHERKLVKDCRLEGLC